MYIFLFAERKVDKALLNLSKIFGLWTNQVSTIKEDYIHINMAYVLFKKHCGFVRVKYVLKSKKHALMFTYRNKNKTIK